ncbi:hypothetical protein DNK48_27755 [Streptomyces malaysiensis subsp. malaysiensis]|uniref:hypothetical protein n=1 Tax=Streptomyces malaysiensis TaxID=92644 RepID=UPI000BFC2996|nr:hypothetical protein [Streptomyces malaysiensis]ATL83342.1 hypothetical protein SMALA_3108 [Streptomyces malaysiensis]QDL72509.1 hypothetical protein DNK48_27755 [Streptomyces malaysiensis]
MSERLTLDDLAVPMRALRLLAADFGHLPAPTVSVSPIYPERLELSLHSGLPGFEAWREALGIAAEDVDHHVHDGGRTRALCASVAYAGAELELVGYGDVPASVQVEAAV